MKFSKEHLWINENELTVGISDFAQQSLGDIVYLDLPEVGDTFSKGEEFGSIESVKSVSALYAPVSMRIVELNENILDQPEIINSSPYEEGWMLKVEVLEKDELEELMSRDKYLELNKE